MEIPLFVEEEVLTSESVSPKPSRSAASLIIVNYNGRGYLERCLQSLFRSLQAGDQVILVDNASADGSADGLEERYPDIEVLRSPKNLGFAAGCNLGASLARGEYLVFLNPDTVVEPGWLEPLVAALQSDPWIGLATPKILLLAQPDRINTAGNDIHLTGLTLCRGAGLDRGALSEPAELSAVSGAAFIIRRQLFEALGGFDPDFFMYMEDTDLSWRARLSGYRCLYVPDSLVYHDYTLRFRPNKTFYQERNRYQMLLKNLRWRSLLVLFPALLLAELVTWGFVITKEPLQWRDKLKAYAWVCTHWGKIMEKRKNTQALRAAKDADLLRHHTTHLDFEQTGDSLVTKGAHYIFNPLYYLLFHLVISLLDD